VGGDNAGWNWLRHTQATVHSHIGSVALCGSYIRPALQHPISAPAQCSSSGFLLSFSNNGIRAEVKVMLKAIIGGLVGAIAFSGAAMATCTPPSNGMTADASLLNTYLTCQFAPLSNPSFAGNITLSASNPYIFSGGSYIAIPHGMYISGGTFYDASQAQLRGGIHNDIGAALELDGGTSAYTYVNGSLGVGTATPVSALQVVGNLTMGDGTASTAYAINTATANGADTDILELAGGGASNDTTRGGFINLFGNEFSYLGLYGDAVISAGQATSGVGGDVLFATDSSNGSMSNPIYRMTITNAGDVGIGTRTPAYTLQVNGSVAGTSAYVNTSDARLKKDIVPIADAMTILERLRGVRFQWRTAQERTVGKNLDLPANEPQIGFIAQEVKAVLPEAVSVAPGPEAVMSLKETKIIPILVEAMKELTAANKNQAGQIALLQHQVRELEQRSADRRTNSQHRRDATRRTASLTGTR
jgi:hypothetical protein